MCKDGIGGTALWISGKSGTGKTTLARIVAASIADEDNIVEIDAKTLTVSAIQEIEKECQYFWIGNNLNGRAYLINEAHGLKPAVIQQLNVTLERIPGHVVWVFTTTFAGQKDMFEGNHEEGPILSRCARVELAQRGLAEPFARKGMEIAQREGKCGTEVKFEAFLRAIKDAGNNMRMLLEDVRSYKFA
jgi:replication-associated recombination protein RarA